MTIVYILLGVCILFSIATIFVCFKTKNSSQLTSKDKEDILKSFNSNIDFISKSLTETQKANGVTKFVGFDGARHLPISS